eukprot:scaffold2209_cov57-Attheya_sp.AAC.3
MKKRVQGSGRLLAVLHENIPTTQHHSERETRDQGQEGARRNRNTATCPMSVPSLLEVLWHSCRESYKNTLALRKCIQEPISAEGSSCVHYMEDFTCLADCFCLPFERNGIVATVLI